MCKQFGIGIVRTVAILSNVVLLFIAGGCLARCLVTYKQLNSYGNVVDTNTQVIPLTGLILSALIVLTVAFGFLGMFLNAFGMICFYVTLVLVLGVVTAITGMYVLAEVAEMTRDRLYFQNRMDQTYNITQDSKAMESIHQIQRDLQCCGFMLGKYQYFNENTVLPSSCCKDPNSEICFGEDIWPDSCLVKLEMFGIVTHSEQGTLMMCVGAHCLMLGGISYVLAMAVRQYYYY